MENTQKPQSEVLKGFLNYQKESRFQKMASDGNLRGQNIIRLHTEVGLNVEDIKTVISSKDSKEVEGFVLSLAKISQEDKKKFNVVVENRLNQLQEETA